MTFSYYFPWVWFGRPKEISKIEVEREPLREFVYLDEVSLASLLASQKGEITDNITARDDEGFLVEAGGKVSTSAPLLPSAEATSRFQTTNSSSLQTVRKSNAQSLFRELHKIDGLRKIQPTNINDAANSLDELFDQSYKNSVYKASDLRRGDLVEFKVSLSASWIFQINTLVAEFSDMFDENPAMFIDSVKFYDLYQARNANKIINKLLAGLIPIDGKVSEYSVISYQEEEYIAHNESLGDLPLDKMPLQIVGVTQHIAYWKDIRRILFADNEFTVLCRMSRSGIQNGWNPIKLADVFKEFAPDLANQIETSSRIAIAQSSNDQPAESIEPNVALLMFALVRYKDVLIETSGLVISEIDLSQIDRMIAELKLEASTAEGQRAAFARVSSMVQIVTGNDIDPTVDLRARERVRTALNLPLFPDLSEKSPQAVAAQSILLESRKPRLLDVEVVAIYW